MFDVELAERDKEPVPGAATGMAVSTRKSVGSTLVKTHSVDIRLLEELRAISSRSPGNESRGWTRAIGFRRSCGWVLDDAIRREEETLAVTETRILITAGGEVVVDVTPAENDSNVTDSK